MFLCSFPQLSNTIRLDFAAAGTDNYIEIDAVLLIGASSVAVAPLNNSYVFFLQDTDSDYYFTGNDSFHFTIDDRKYYMRYRDVDGSDGTIRLVIEPVNDAPHAQNVTLYFNGTSIVFYLTVSDPDGPDELSIFFDSLPSYGSLAVASSLVTVDEEVQVTV